MIILGIETSCDETSICIYDEKRGIIVNKTINQNKVHSLYGGIIPELASKIHAKKIIKIIKKNKKKINLINLIAYTAGPGLPNSLLIGATIGKTLSYLYKIPSIPINHIEGHIMSIMSLENKPIFPYLSLVTSGANTLLIKVSDFNKYKIIGKSLDNSAGEIFDKIANLIGLKYPGGYKLSKLAKLGEKHFIFPKPLLMKNNLNFSFSGIYTHTVNLIKKIGKLDNHTKYNIAYALEDSITDILYLKVKRALKIFNLKQVTFGGGVSANNKLRSKIKLLLKKKINIFFPHKSLCTDNALMIAYAGLIKKNNKKYLNKHQNLEININPKWKIGDKLI